MTRVLRPAVAALLATTLLVSACTSAAPSAPAEPTHAPAAWDTDVTWRPCPELPREALARAMPAGVLPGIVMDLLSGVAASVLTAGRSYECATLPVPRDRAAVDADADADPGSDSDSGATFEIALVRVRAGSAGAGAGAGAGQDGGDEDRGRLGSLVVNPGGPGASGVDAAVYLSLQPLLGGLPDEVTDNFDIVGFDPRGVGRSSPLDCFSDADLDESFGAEPDPVSRADFDAAVADSRRRTEACGAQYGDTLRHYSTRQTAHDLDAVRAAVGDDQLTYLGYSYGTLLGAVYAHLYPQNVRAMVLDGAVDPRGRGDGPDSGGGQAAGFERALDNFAEWCDTTPAQCPLGPDSRAAVTGAIDQARHSPVTGPDGREATAGWVFWAVVSALYLRELWPQLGTAIDSLERGDPGGVFTLADLYTGRDEDGTYPNMFDANTAVNCADDGSDRTVEQVRERQEQQRDEYPLFGAPLAVMGLDCALWPGEPDPYPVGPAQGAPPILVIGTTGDPATPYEAAPRLAELLGTGVLLTWEGEGHTVYPQPGCVNDAVHAYLVDRTAPGGDLTCSPAA